MKENGIITCGAGKKIKIWLRSQSAGYKSREGDQDFQRFAWLSFTNSSHLDLTTPPWVSAAYWTPRPNAAASFSSVDLNGPSIERDVTDWWKSSYRLSKTLEDGFPAAAQCAAQLREDTTAFREHLPVIQVWNLYSRKEAVEYFLQSRLEKFGANVYYCLESQSFFTPF